MREPSQRGRVLALISTAAAGAALIAGCGSSKTEPTKLSLSVAEKGKTGTITGPKSAKGGLVEVDFENPGTAPHGVQLIQYTGDHTSADVLKQLGKNGNKIPSWLKAQGGTSAVAPGKSGTATLNLPAGNYVMIDSASFTSGAPPTPTNLKLTSGDSGDLPSTDATVTAASKGKDKYAWEISGLKSGNNDITFNSKGEPGEEHDAIHLIIAAPVNGKAPPLSQIKKDLASNGPPPKYVDFPSAQSTAVLDGGESQTTTFDLPKAGQYIFFCPFTDRDGKGKPHDQEGLLSVETVK